MYHALAYEDPRYESYQEFRNEDGSPATGRAEAGRSAAFGLVFPESNPDQTYQQLLVRGLYVVSGKLDLRGTAGIEFRQMPLAKPAPLSQSSPYQQPISLGFRPRSRWRRIAGRSRLLPVITITSRSVSRLASGNSCWAGLPPA